MGLFLKEEDFLQYIEETYPDVKIEKGHTIVSVNIISMQPIMSFAYITEELVIAAKYQRQLQIFTDHILFTKKQIKQIEYVANGLNAQLIVHTNEKLPDERDITLTLNVNTMTGNRWHKENLKQLRKTFQQSE
ncbi:hypothetical protein [Enterococcus olivae]